MILLSSKQLKRFFLNRNHHKINIEYTLRLSNTDIDFLTQKINQGTSQFGNAYPIDGNGS